MSTTQTYILVLLGLTMLCCARTTVMVACIDTVAEAAMLPKSLDRLKLFNRVVPRCMPRFASSFGG